jgi:hypothetical protein
MKRAPWLAICLFLASPLVGEYLLGSLPASMIFLLPLMAAMYGSAALLIRETVRRTGRGWPSIFLLAIAYGLFEEGFVTQSLFNPNYLHLRLLDYGWLPAPGTALPWLIYVIGIHAVWSIAVPIALVESAAPTRRDLPWIGKAGLVIYSVLFVAGCALIAVFTYKQMPFMASPAQLAGTALLIVALCAMALRLRRRSEPQRGLAAPAAPRPVALFIASFIAGSLFMQLEYSAAYSWRWPWMVTVAAMLGIVCAFLAFVRFARRGSWNISHCFSLAAGGFLVYVWKGFETDVLLHGRADLVGHTIIAAVGCALLAFVGRRVRMAPGRS